jgi:multicomponent Na+:H+ antiporter subunit G
MSSLLASGAPTFYWLVDFLKWFVPAALLVVGVLLNLVGCLGLLRLPDVYNRLQAVATCVTLGTCCMLLGAGLGMAWSGLPASGSGAGKAVLCLLFIMLTGPAAAHAIARGAHRVGVRLWDGSVGDDYHQDKSRRPES